LKIGEPCYGGGCVTKYCFNAILPGGVIPVGVCACNPSNNAGCKGLYKCDFLPLVEIGHLTAFLQWAQPVAKAMRSVSQTVVSADSVSAMKTSMTFLALKMRNALLKKVMDMSARHLNRNWD
jgi:hypothetical protein